LRLDDFTWRDGDRTIRFATAALQDAPATLADLGWDSYDLLSTERALADASDALVASARNVHEVPPGPVNETAAELFDSVAADRLVAFGGGRVIDTAKAIAAVRGGEVAAIPTTLSGAEMTRIHKLPHGQKAKDGLNRPVVVIGDPEAMTAQRDRERRASAINALAHSVDCLYTPGAHPVSRFASLESSRLIANGVENEKRRELALGAILAGYAIDTAGLGLHHVMSQSTVRAMRIPHAETNAALLPRVIEALLPRVPAEMAALAETLAVAPSELPSRIEGLAGGRRTLGEIGADPEKVEETLDTIEARPELESVPETPDRVELRRIIETAW
jgi:alcohol dehydrogenase class IV